MIEAAISTPGEQGPASLHYETVMAERPVSGHMLCAIVLYLNDNKAGPGFFKLATELGELAPGASADDEFAFWVGEVKTIHEHYRAGR